MIRSALIASIAAFAAAVCWQARADPPHPGSAPGQADFMAKHYPSEALARGEEGRVGFRITISKDGFIKQCDITESSGYTTLDRETCDFIAQYASLKPARDAKGSAYETIQTGQVAWKLPPGVARSTAPKVAASLPPSLICRRTRDSHSLIAHTTECMTNAEWAIQDKLVRQSLEDRIGRGTCTDHGC